MIQSCRLTDSFSAAASWAAAFAASFAQYEGLLIANNRELMLSDVAPILVSSC